MEIPRNANPNPTPRVLLLGIPIDAVTRTQALDRIRAFLHDGSQHHVMTPNSEMLVAAARDDMFRRILVESSFNLPDSAGLLWAARWTGQHLPERVAGVDTVTALCASLNEETPVFLLGAEEGIAERAGAKLRTLNPRLRIAGTMSGSPRAEESSEILRRIHAASPALLLVAFGAPAQDLWIREHLSALPNVKVAMGVGGTFDFLAGKRKRAPQILRSLGLEWAWRLLLEPRRIGRIFTAVIVFPLSIIRYGREAR